jgi:serine/threonine protein kinase
MNDRSGVTLVEKLGEGLQGTVWAARIPSSARLVAIKFYREEFAGERVAIVARLARIFSPHLLEIIRYERQPDGGLMVISEYCAGGSLAKALKDGARWRLADLLMMGRQLAEALDALHREGIVHGDVTPANVFREKRTGTTRWVLGDFGSARFASDSAPPAYRTLGFSAPELEEGRISEQSDVYSLAAVMHACVDLGRAEGVPPRLTALLARCVDARPEARPSAREIAAELSGLQAELKVRRFVSGVGEMALVAAVEQSQEGTEVGA